MSQTLENLGPYAWFHPPAIVGMKADSMFDNVDTMACDAQPIGFGLVVSSTTAHSIRVKAGGDVANVRGISLHDHLVGSRGQYYQYDAVSTLTRGRVWAKVKDGEGADDINDGVKVSYDADTGEVSAAGAGAGPELPNATFRSKAVSIPNATQLVFGVGATAKAAVVELHHPFQSGPTGPAGPAGPTGGSC